MDSPCDLMCPGPKGLLGAGDLWEDPFVVCVPLRQLLSSASQPPSLKLRPIISLEVVK